MKKLLSFLSIAVTVVAFSQQTIPLDTNNWEITGSYVLEEFEGQQSIYIKGGALTLKDTKFLNGTIEYDIFLREVRGFPGVTFRVVGQNGEKFYIRPHQSGNPDANQAVPIVEGITPWQLNFGPKYSFPYKYNYDAWTHVKIVVSDDRAQVFLDDAEKPNLSWKLFHPIREGDLILNGGGGQALHIANIKVDPNATELKDFNPIEREEIPGLIAEWEISDKFEEQLLDDPNKLGSVINGREWGRKIQVEEGTAANISRQQRRYDGQSGNTVFAKIVINSSKDQIKQFDFGYSDRVVAILNGEALYRGSNRFQSRDYRYLGTIGLFDSIYLNLKKGENTLLMAVSEDFGGWLITGKFTDKKGIEVN